MLNLTCLIPLEMVDLFRQEMLWGLARKATTITALAAIRCISVIQYDRTWYVVTRERFITSKYVQLIWVFSLILALPPVMGIGEYVHDIGMIRYWQDYVVFGVIISKTDA